MRTYTWSEFFDNCWDWADTTKKAKISHLTDIGAGEEIVEVILDIQDEKVRSQLIRKSIEMGAKFTSEDIVNLDGELTDELYRQLAEYAGVNADNPHEDNFDEENMTWDDFYDSFEEWDDEVLLRRVNKLDDIGSAEEVADAISVMWHEEAEKLLYDKAVASGIIFTDEQEFDMGHWSETFKKNMLTDEDIEQLKKNIDIAYRNVKNAERETRRERYKKTNIMRWYWQYMKR